MNIEEKRREIKRVIGAYTDDDCLYPDKSCAFHSGYYCISDENAYKCLVKRLTELGVGIIDEKENIPEIHPEQFAKGYRLPKPAEMHRIRTGMTYLRNEAGFRKTYKLME